MNDINAVTLVGRVVRDISNADIHYLSSGSAVLNFSIAVNESVKNGKSWSERASFFDVTFYGQQVESLKSYLTKGKQTAIAGTLQQQRWQKDGATKSKIVIIAKTIQLLGSAHDGNMGSLVNTPPAEEDDLNDIPF